MRQEFCGSVCKKLDSLDKISSKKVRDIVDMCLHFKERDLVVEHEKRCNSIFNILVKL